MTEGLFHSTSPPAPIMRAQGREANHSGKFLEEVIEREFARRGCESVLWRHCRGNKDLFAKHRLMKRVPYESIYGGRPAHSEFVFLSGATSLVRIECRWQETPGSVDEKFPYLLLNARDRMPEPNIWLVIDGDGARPKGIAWLRKECAAVSFKNIRVMSLTEAKKAIKRLIEEGIA